jgi:hypothetical protein
MDQLALEAGEEAIGHRVGVRVTDAAHQRSHLAQPHLELAKLKVTFPRGGPGGKTTEKITKRADPSGQRCSISTCDWMGAPFASTMGVPAISPLLKGRPKTSG